MGTSAMIPPDEYWESLSGDWTDEQFSRLRELSDLRLQEFKASDLPPPAGLGRNLLEKLTADGWLERTVRRECPNCHFELDAEEASLDNCPECDESYVQHGGVIGHENYVRALAPARPVDWVVAIHGMNTTGAWQQEFNWLLGRTWGKSVPVAVYKYGIIRIGVILPWRRRKFRKQLRTKLYQQSLQARKSGYSGRPDVIAHSFGTWLLGHLLMKELDRDENDRLRFGRVILTGCILKPDFDWQRIKAAKLVDEVLNHYGSKDPVVPLAQFTIWNSGPSGRIGFDGDEVINVRAEGFGHSDLFSIKKCVIDDKPFQLCPEHGLGETHLSHTYKEHWKPFLTLPGSDLSGLSNHDPGLAPWKQVNWLIRGSLFPVFAIFLLLALIALIIGFVGGWLSGFTWLVVPVAKYSALGLLLLGSVGAVTGITRWLHGKLRKRK